MSIELIPNNMKTTCVNKDNNVVKVYGVTFTLDKEPSKYAKYVPQKVKYNQDLVANSKFKF